MTSRSDGVFIAQVDDEPWAPGDPVGLPNGLEWRLYESSEERRPRRAGPIPARLRRATARARGRALRRDRRRRDARGRPRSSPRRLHPRRTRTSLTARWPTRRGSPSSRWSRADRRSTTGARSTSRTTPALTARSIAHVDDEPWAPAEGMPEGRRVSHLRLGRRRQHGRPAPLPARVRRAASRHTRPRTTTASSTARCTSTAKFCGAATTCMRLPTYRTARSSRPPGARCFG